MSEAPPIGVAPAWPMVRAMVGVGLGCGLLIVVVYQLTKPVIARNRAAALERAIFEVLPEARSSESLQFVDGRFGPLRGGQPGEVVHAGYDEQGRLVGLALEARGMGYQDEIHVLYGYAPDAQAVIGIQVLSSRETPGLGDRIETDEDFLRNFEQLDVSVVASGSEIANPIETVKHGEKKHAWQIDGITGATVSSVAIGKILRRDTERWIPVVRERLSDFEKRSRQAP